MPSTILIVEDHANIRRFVRTTLELEGYRVQEAATLQEAIAIARRARPALILLDLSLPDGSGWDFLHTMQAQPDTRGLRIVILTASADRGMAERGLAAGAIAFLTKPIAAGELVTQVRTMIDAQPTASERSD